MEIGDLLHCRQTSKRLMRHQGKLFILVKKDNSDPRLIMVQSLSTGKRRWLSRGRFEVVNESR